MLEDWLVSDLRKRTEKAEEIGYTFVSIPAYNMKKVLDELDVLKNKIAELESTNV